MISNRPKLSVVAPLTAAVCWGYGIVNIILGIGLMAAFTASPPLAVANILPYLTWGMLFFLVGVLGIVGLLINNWNLVRQIQLMGILLKAIWLVALVLRVFQDPQTIAITAVWAFFTYIQVVIYIYFTGAEGHYGRA